MESQLNSSCLNQKSYIKQGLANNHLNDSSQLFANFINVQVMQQNPQPFDPNCFKQQYNVIVEGVIFDVLAPCDFLKDLRPEQMDIEE